MDDVFYPIHKILDACVNSGFEAGTLLGRVIRVAVRRDADDHVSLCFPGGDVTVRSVRQYQRTARIAYQTIAQTQSQNDHIQCPADLDMCPVPALQRRSSCPRRPLQAALRSICARQQRFCRPSAKCVNDAQILSVPISLQQANLRATMERPPKPNAAIQ